MAEFNSLIKPFQNLEKTLANNKIKALNKGLSSGYGFFKRELSKVLGITQKPLSKRIKVTKLTSTNLVGTLFLGTKQGLILSEFKPKTTIVNNRNGVRVTVAGVSFTVPGGWLATVKSGKKLVLGRKQAFTNGMYTGKGKRYPTIALRTPEGVLYNIANKLRDKTTSTILNTFDMELKRSLDDLDK